MGCLQQFRFYCLFGQEGFGFFGQEGQANGVNFKYFKYLCLALANLAMTYLVSISTHEHE